MKAFLLSLLLTCSALAQHPFADVTLAQPSGGDTWLYNQTLWVTNSGGTNELTDYAVKFTLSYSNGMSTYFQDLRFYQGSTLLPHWKQDIDPTNRLIAWVKLKTIPASANTNLTLYYGNASAPDSSDGAATFPYLFDTFGGQAWKKMKHMPDHKQQHGSDQLHGKIYVLAGGGQTIGYTNSMYAYDVATDTWTECADLPWSSQSLYFRALGGYLYAWCGLAGAGVTTNALARYNPTNDSWTLLTSAGPRLEDGASAVISNTFLAYIGGLVDGAAVTNSQLMLYNPATDAWTTNTAMPFPHLLGDGGAVDAAGNIYVWSGITNMASYPFYTANRFLHKYVPSTDTWSLMSNSLQVAAYKEVDFVNGWLYSWGGGASHNTEGSKWGQGYDVTNDWWRYKAIYPEYQMGLAQAVYGNYIYVGGGVTNNSIATTTNSFYRYDTTLDVSNTLGANWTISYQGTAGSVAEQREGFHHAVGLDGADASALITSTSTFTNSFAIETRRRLFTSGDYHYNIVGFGSGSAVGANGLGADYFQTYKQSGYAAAIVHGAGASLREMPASGAVAVIGANFSPTTQTNWTRPTDVTVSYDKAGVLRWLANGTQVDTATDTTFLTSAKNVYAASGKSTTAGRGADAYYDWIIVRPHVLPEPTPQAP